MIEHQMVERIGSFYAAQIGRFRAQVRAEHPRLNEGVLRSGLPFSKDPMPPCVDGPHHLWDSYAAFTGAPRGVNICRACGLGSVYDSA